MVFMRLALLRPVFIFYLATFCARLIKCHFFHHGERGVSCAAIRYVQPLARSDRKIPALVYRPEVFRVGGRVDSTIVAAIIGAIATIIVAIVGIWFQKRSKGGRTFGDQTSNGGSGHQTQVDGNVSGGIGNTEIDAHDNITNVTNNITNISIQQISQETGVPLAALRGILSSMGETALAEATPEKIESLLKTKAREYLSLQAQLQKFTGDDPEVKRLREAARQALQEGRLPDAKNLLRQARQRVHEAGQPLRKQEASIAAEQAETAKLEPNPASYREAADLFGEAASLIATDDAPQAREYRLRQASALGDLGHEFGDNGTLREAIALYRQILSGIDRATEPFDWAMTQNNLGAALSTLGERESGTARLEEAVAAYRAALEERTRERVPLNWAMTQNNLGAALQSLGKRESGTARLEEAVAAYRAVLAVYKASGASHYEEMVSRNLARAEALLRARKSS
jgi:tetratricopeptide (TPR) repeat protein